MATNIRLPRVNVTSFMSSAQIDSVLSGSGTLETTAAIQKAAVYLNSLGRGVLVFAPGKYGRLFSASTGTLCSFANMTDVSCEGYGATLEVDTSKVITASDGAFFTFNACTNVFVDGFVTDGPALDVSSGTVKGYEFVRAVNGTRNIVMPHNRVRNSLAGFICSKAEGDSDALRTQNIQIGFLDVENCWYGINGQYSGDNMNVEHLRTNGVHRSFFVYGASHVKAHIYSRNHAGHDVPIGSSRSVGMEDVEIWYHSDAESNRCSQAKVLLSFNGATAQTIRNIKIHFDVRFPNDGSPGSSAFTIQKLDNTANSDKIDRGHVLENLVIDGVVAGEGSNTPSNFGAATLGMDPNCTWGTGDHFRQVRFENLRVEPRSAAGNPTFIFGNVTDQITLRNVICTRDFVIQQQAVGGDTRIPYTGKLILDNVRCLNRYALSTDGNPPLDNIRAVGTLDTVRMGWTGKTIGNLGAGGNMTWTLPPAIRGLQYVFVRNDEHVIDIAPSGSDRIGEGAIGQKLRMNAAGNLVKLHCATAGRWTIEADQGPMAFV